MKTIREEAADIANAVGKECNLDEQGCLNLVVPIIMLIGSNISHDTISNMLKITIDIAQKHTSKIHGQQQS